MLTTIQLINSNIPIPWSMDIIFGIEEDLSGVKNVETDRLWLNAEPLLKCSRHSQEFGSEVSVCTKHTPAPKLQALSPLIMAPGFCGCMCLGKGYRTARKWRQKPGLRCQ